MENEAISEQMSDGLAALMREILATEREQLMGVFTRMCIKRGKPVEPEHIHGVPAGKNATNYYYKFGTKEQYFLMTAKFSVGESGPALDIDFNPELVFNNEL